jgi:hypothetical protein
MSVADTLRSQNESQRPLNIWATRTPVAAMRPLLQATRRRKVKAGEWELDPENTGKFRFAPIPQPAWSIKDANLCADGAGVADILSIVERKVEHVMEDVLKGKHNREAHGSKPRIEGKDGIGVLSNEALASLTGLPVSTAARARKRLAEKKHRIHEIDMVLVDGTPLSTKTPEGLKARRKQFNREPLRFRILTYEETHAALRSDSKIAKIEDKLYLHNGRSTSRRLLTPKEAEAWEAAKHAAKCRPRSPTTLAPSHQPAIEPPKVGRPEMRRERNIVGGVPPDQQGILNWLAGQTEGSRGTPGLCDTAISNQILANAQAVAAAHGRVFPPERIGDFCMQKIFDNNKRLDPTTGSREHGYFIWKPSIKNPAGFMAFKAKDYDLVGAYLDWLEKHKRKKRAELADKILEQLGYLRKNPESESVKAFLKELREENEAVYQEAFAQNDKQHAEGSSWPKAKTMTPAGGSDSSP